MRLYIVMTAWVWMGGAIVFEIAATTMLTYSQGLTRGVLAIVTAAGYVVSYACLARALRSGIELSAAYAIWSGIGTAALAVLGAALFGEVLTLPKVGALVLIVAGVAALHLSPSQPDAVYLGRHVASAALDRSTDTPGQRYRGRHSGAPTFP